MSVLHKLKKLFFVDKNNEAIAEVIAINKRLLEEKEQIAAELSVHKEREQAEIDRKSSVDPWVEIKSAEYDEIRGFKIELDWNPAFVQYLKENNIKGSSEEEAVQKWVGMLYNDLSERLADVAIEQSAKKTTNDYL